MRGTPKKIRPVYIAPKAVVLSGVAQGACMTGSQYISGNCKQGGNAGNNCIIGNIAGNNCNTGNSTR
jgi:hypothetical protein